jgi:hypothetical protein
MCVFEENCLGFSMSRREEGQTGQVDYYSSQIHNHRKHATRSYVSWVVQYCTAPEYWLNTQHSALSAQRTQMFSPSSCAHYLAFHLSSPLVPQYLSPTFLLVLFVALTLLYHHVILCDRSNIPGNRCTWSTFAYRLIFIIRVVLIRQPFTETNRWYQNGT